jgi:hypothetical protein
LVLEMLVPLRGTADNTPRHAHDLFIARSSQPLSLRLISVYNVDFLDHSDMDCLYVSLPVPSRALNC